MAVHPSGFQERRQALRSCVSTAEELARALSEDAALRRLSDLAAWVDEERFYVAVLGEFKRGKSTFLNALLGERVMPTGVLPVTSVITEIAWAAERTATVTFSEGRNECVALSSIGDFVTERSNPENRLGVERVRVGYPAPLLRGGVVLVDTPGVGSVFRHNTDVTLAMLPDVDAVIFITAADPPVSDSERSFLLRIREHAHKVLFVINKIDLVEEGDLAEVVAFTRQVIADAVSEHVDPFPLSALRAHDATGSSGSSGSKAASRRC
jgi:predicted GTPase